MASTCSPHCPPPGPCQSVSMLQVSDGTSGTCVTPWVCQPASCQAACTLHVLHPLGVQWPSSIPCRLPCTLLKLTRHGGPVICQQPETAPTGAHELGQRCWRVLQPSLRSPFPWARCWLRARLWWPLALCCPSCSAALTSAASRARSRR